MNGGNHQKSRVHQLLMKFSMVFYFEWKYVWHNQYAHNDFHMHLPLVILLLLFLRCWKHIGHCFRKWVLSAFCALVCHIEVVQKVLSNHRLLSKKIIEFLRQFLLKQFVSITKTNSLNGERIETLWNKRTPGKDIPTFRAETLPWLSLWNDRFYLITSALITMNNQHLFNDFLP